MGISSFTIKGMCLVFHTPDSLSEKEIINAEKDGKLIILLYTDFRAVYSEPIDTWRKNVRVCPLYMGDRTFEDMKIFITDCFKKGASNG